MGVNLNKITTEQRNINSINIDVATTKEILTIINNEDKTIAVTIANNINNIAEVVDAIFPLFEKGGRVIYIGAGTSGRIGVLDASEMLPTYGVENKFIGLIAGGDKALRLPIEGAEDSEKLAIEDLKKLNLTSLDTVIGIAASGRTPYVISGLKFAKAQNSLAVGLSMTDNSALKKVSDYNIEVVTGPEVITGSTRMKAGTATKLACNMISTSLMIKYGKVYQNLMVDVKPTNEKLISRTIKIVQEITNASEEEIKKTLQLANFQCKNAIIMIMCGVDFSTSEKLLEVNNNNLSLVLKNN